MREGRRRITRLFLLGLLQEATAGAALAAALDSQAEVVAVRRGLRDLLDGAVSVSDDGRTVAYQKHMTHHLLPEIDRGWLKGLTHGFLIRDPREMLTSLVHHMPQPTLADSPFAGDILEMVKQKAKTMMAENRWVSISRRQPPEKTSSQGVSKTNGCPGRTPCPSAGRSA